MTTTNLHFEPDTNLRNPTITASVNTTINSALNSGSPTIFSLNLTTESVAEITNSISRTTIDITGTSTSSKESMIQKQQ